MRSTTEDRRRSKLRVQAAPRRHSAASRAAPRAGEMSIALRIFLVAFKAVLKVFIIGAVGCVARRRGLDAPTCKAMAKLNGTILLPCLLFVALGGV